MNKKKMLLIAGIVVLIVLVGYFIFGDYIKAQRLEIDVQYLKDPQYCVQNSDCVPTFDMSSVVNIYNYREKRFYEGTGRMKEYCGSECLMNRCSFQKCEFKEEDLKYLNNSKYCEQDSDCAQDANCNAVNIYNFDINTELCKTVACGSNCIDNICQLDNCEDRYK